MAKTCIACGKNIGLLTVRIPLLGDDGENICADCFGRMPSVLNDLYQKRIYPSKSELMSIEDEVLNELSAKGFNTDTQNFIKKYIDIKVSNAKDEVGIDDGKIRKKCPICKRQVSYENAICSDCGYDFAQVEVLQYREIAEIYNKRISQYKRNPYYEYDYIVVQNNADGSTNKEKITEIITEHALQGWRLVTMYSNEIGKNMITIAGAGVNVTLSEDILLFERCIKQTTDK